MSYAFPLSIRYDKKKEVYTMIRCSFDEKYVPILDKFGLSTVPRSLLCLLSYGKKEYICQEEVPVSHLLIVLKGRAKILTYTEEGKAFMYSFSEEGSFIGEVELLTQKKGAALYVQAVTPMECIGIPLREGSAILRKNLQFMNCLSELLAAKLMSANYNASRMVLYTLENRLCSYIEMSSPNLVFEEPLTQVSEILGTSYRHLLRTIEKLCREEILKKGSHGYHIRDLSALHQRGRGFYSNKSALPHL